jgi:hypothetical protein
LRERGERGLLLGATVLLVEAAAVAILQTRAAMAAVVVAVILLRPEAQGILAAAVALPLLLAVLVAH